jgi:hypothetical protein
LLGLGHSLDQKPDILLGVFDAVKRSFGSSVHDFVHSWINIGQPAIPIIPLNQSGIKQETVKKILPAI